MKRRCWMVTVGIVTTLCASSITGRADGEIPVTKATRDFMNECGRLAASDSAKANGAVRGKGEWIFLASELRHVSAGKFWGAASTVVSEAVKDDARDPAPALIDFAQQLKALGIDLVLVPVPPKVIVYPDRLTDAYVANEVGLPARADPYHRAFYAMLREMGLNVLDLTDALLTARTDDDALGLVYCKQDSHWSPRGAALAAEHLQRELQKHAWYQERQRVEYYTLPNTVQITGDLWSMLGDTELPRESVRCLQVSSTPDVLTPVARSDQSPLLLLADSHGLVFSDGGDMHARGAGMPDLLALKLGMPIDMISRRGSAATSIRIDLARKFYRDESYRDAKKLIVWLFAAREFTEAMGWRQLKLSM